MNKYLEVILNHEEGDDIDGTIKAIQAIGDRDESIEMVNILVALDIIPKEVLASVWAEFGRLNK